jgi:predicted dehydrogenase
MSNLLLIGLGKMGNAHLKTIEESAKSHLYGIVDPLFANNNDSEPRVRCYSDLSEVDLNDSNIDGAIVASSTSSHYEIVKTLLLNKIPVLVEKPVTVKIKELHELLKISKESSTIMRVGFIELYNPVIDHIEKLIIENINNIKISRLSPPDGMQRGLSDVLYDLAIHDISIINKLFNLKDFQMATKDLNKKNDLVSEANISFTIGNINFLLETSNIADEKKRIWEVFTDNFLYVLDLVELKITKKDLITKKIFSEQQLTVDTQPLDAQLDDFILYIKKNNNDYKHLEIIKNTHRFIQNLY